MSARDVDLERGFERLGNTSPWMASFSINGRVYGSGLDHAQDVRPPHFFQVVPNPNRILELGSCQGGGTFQLAKHPGVDEVVALEGRDFNFEKALFAKEVLEVENVTFLEANLESFDFTPLGRFDAVYCVGVLYHLPNPWELLLKLRSVADILYINTHYCSRTEVAMTLHGYDGKQWLESGYHDPLSGMSSWSWWPTLDALAMMILDAGFVPEILEFDTMGLGQSPHGTTIVAKAKASLPEHDRQRLLDKMHQVLDGLPATAGRYVRETLSNDTSSN